ncbi:hypothetical protein ACN4EE_18085 [Geminocystis sp. CENA526]|uniref:hypothetical protein n=1 Tax=Geminocystis sp. CENA526 TaxID=1355871 RepID=UPI003D6F2864
MSNKLNEVLEPQNVNNDDLSQKEIKSDLRRVFNGGYWIDIDDEIEPDYTNWDLRYYEPPQND